MRKASNRAKMLISANTISMPGFILQQGKATVSGGSYQFAFDPVELNKEFPNLDLIGRDSWRAGLSDTFSIGLLLRGKQGAKTVYRSNTITIQGDQVFVGGAFPDWSKVNLPVVLKSG